MSGFSVTVKGMPGATHPCIVKWSWQLALSGHFWDGSGLSCGTNISFSHKDSRGRIMAAVENFHDFLFFAHNFAITF